MKLPAVAVPRSTIRAVFSNPEPKSAEAEAFPCIVEMSKRKSSERKIVEKEELLNFE